MRKNEETKVIGNKVTLVPYRKHHVPKYHEWMKSGELQELTASEPLSLDEEYQMQQSWNEDEDKCTFIVLDTDTYEKTSDEIASMVGDTNLFLTTSSDDSDVAEVEVMIAEPNHRGRGLGKEALLLMMAYGLKTLGRHTFVAKIKTKNDVSRQLFEKLGFDEVDRLKIFDEVVYKKSLQNWRQLLDEHHIRYEEQVHKMQ